MLNGTSTQALLSQENVRLVLSGISVSVQLREHSGGGGGSVAASDAVAASPALQAQSSLHPANMGKGRVGGRHPQLKFHDEEENQEKRRKKRKVFRERADDIIDRRWDVTIKTVVGNRAVVKHVECSSRTKDVIVEVVSTFETIQEKLKPIVRTLKPKAEIIETAINTVVSKMKRHK